MASLLPQTVGTYRVIAQLGQGGMARALLAMRQGPGGFRKLFVIKQLKPDLTDPGFVEMFLDEARLAAMLSHPNVVQTHEVGAEDECFISMDYLEGQSLGRVLRRVTRPKMPLALHVKIIADVLSGLHYAHELTDYDGTPLNVVHRDVSPGNVFLTYDGQVKLLDFGIAKAEGAHFQTEVGVLKGKLSYMAPEQALSNVVDRRSDIFSVGVMLWEAIAQRRLVERGESEPVTLHNRVNGIWPKISEVRPNAAPDLLAACERAMAPHAEDRFATAEEFRSALLACLEKSNAVLGAEDLAELVTSHFAPEREKLAAKIAEKIESGGNNIDGDVLIPRSRSTTDLPFAESESPLPDFPDSDSAKTSLRMAPKRRTPKIIAAIAAASAIALGATVYIVASAGSDDETDGDEETTASTASAPDVSPLEEEQPPAWKETRREISIVLSAEPVSATLTLDGEVLPSNPYQKKVEADDKQHRLVVTLEGHETAERVLAFDKDVHIEVALTKLKPSSSRVARRNARIRAERVRAEKERLAAAEKSAQEAAAKAAAKREAEAKAKAEARPKAGDLLTGPKKKKTREIDEKNPYQ